MLCFFLSFGCFAKVWLFSLLGFTASPAVTSRHPTWHQLHHQIKHQPIIQIPELNNNDISGGGKVCLSENCRIFSSNHSPHVRRCLSVSTAATTAHYSPVAALAVAATSISSSIVDSTTQKLSPNPPPSRLYTRHTSRQTSLSPRVFTFLDDPSSTELSSDGVFLRSDNSFNGFENHDYDALAKSPSATYSYLKSFFRRVKTPDPIDERHSSSPTTPTTITVPSYDTLACDRLITDTVSMPSTPHSTFHSNPFSLHSKLCEL